MSKRILKMLIFIIVLIVVKSDLVFAYKSYKYGDKVNVMGSDYYVIENSDENQDYVYLLKKKPLTTNQLIKYGKDENGNFFVNKYVDYSDDEIVKYDEIAFYTSETCRAKCNEFVGTDCSSREYIRSGCTNDYEKSDIKKVLENWKNDYFDESELKVVNGYSVKLLSRDDIIDKLHYELQTVVICDDSVTGYYSTENSLDVSLYSWTMTGSDDTSKEIINDSDHLSDRYVYDIGSVQPTVYLKKCAIEGSCSTDKHNRYKYGQKIKFRGEDYYVLQDSDSKQDYVTLLKGNPLTINDIQKYGLQYFGASNNISYYTSSKCNEDDHSECKLDYDESDVKILVDNWANDNFYDGELQVIEGYKARLINEDELLTKLYFEPGLYSSLNTNIYQASEETLEVLKRNSTWTMVPFSDYEDNVFIIDYTVSGRETYYTESVMPVINLNKCAIEGNCVLNKSNDFKVGDEVTYNGQKYHVLKNSDEYTNYVTLLKDEPLTESEIKKYYDGEVSLETGLATINFATGGNNAYNKSIVKNIINKWAKDEFKNNLVVDENSKYASKILSTEDLVQYLGFEWGAADAEATSFTYLATSNTPSWFKNITYDFWLMTPYEDSTTDNWVVSKGKSTIYKSASYYKYVIKPVVNISKCAINPNGAGCKKCTYAGTKINFLNYKEYTIGNVVTYKGEEYYVVQNSSKLLPYVTLLKKEPLTAEQINTYGKVNNNSVVNVYTYYNEDDITQGNRTGRFDEYYSHNAGKSVTGSCVRDYPYQDCDGEEVKTSVYNYTYDVVVPGKAYEYDSGYGGMLYYTDSSCGLFNGKAVIERDDEACKKYNSYDLSNIKVVVDNWKNDTLNDDDLVEIGGYKARILKKSEFHDIKYNTNSKYLTQWYDPDYVYWLMEAYNTKIWNLNYYGGYNVDYYFEYKLIYPAVRPVINVSKCALEDGCFNETFNLATCDEPIPDSENPPKKIEIEVENTLKTVSFIFVFVSIALIIIGLIIVGFNYYRIKKINKR